MIKDIKYFAELYLKIRTTYDYEFLVYNDLLDQTQQHLLIMSHIKLEDEKEKEKITEVSRKFDQFHTTLRLLDEYESNSFQLFIHTLNSQLRNKEIDVVKSEFDKLCIEFLEKKGVIEKEKYSSISELYKYSLFQNIRHRLLNFSKYVLMRVDRELAKSLDKPSYVSDSLKSLEDRFNQYNRKRYGLHLEHIIANNDKNKSLFTDSNGDFDEIEFNQVRNKFGALVLLKDKQNLSSGNDIYKKKFQTYKKSNFIWNEFLVGHIDKFDVSRLPNGIAFDKQEPDKNGLFPLKAVEDRQKELFKMIKYIWGNKGI